MLHEEQPVPARLSPARYADGVRVLDLTRVIADPVVTRPLSAWEPAGPWSSRPGFDSLVQCPTGIAHIEATDSPEALPAQVLDHATAYLADREGGRLAVSRERHSRRATAFAPAVFGSDLTLAAERWDRIVEDTGISPRIGTC